MPAHAGKAPWYKAVSETTKLGRQRTTLSSGNMEWDLSSGWHFKRERGWKGKGLKSGTVRKVTRIAPDGTKVTAYETEGYDDALSFHAHETVDSNAIEYGMNAFDESDPSHGKIFSFEGAGHIAKIEYAQMQQVLRVTFVTDGAIALFFRVPTAIAGELIHLAQNPDAIQMRRERGKWKPRHLLGIRFWDLVRIRGQRHGARYPFEYQKHGTYKLTGSNKRYTVTLSDENIKKILGGRFYGRDIKPGEKVTAILSEEEYAKWQDEQATHGHTELTQQLQTVNNKDTGKGVIETGGVDMNYMANHAASFANGPGLEGILGAQDYARYLDLMSKMQQAKNQAQQDRAAALADVHVDMSAEAQKALWTKGWALAKEQSAIWRKEYAIEKKAGTSDYDSYADYEFTKIQDYVFSEMDKYKTGNEDFADKRYKTYHQKASLNPARVTVTPSQVFSSDKAALNDYLRLSALIRKADNLPKYASIHVGRGWTINELKDFANAYVPGNISEAHQQLYKKLIQSGEYEAALNFLKDHKHNIYSNKKLIATRPYAGQHDFLVQGN